MIIITYYIDILLYYLFLKNIISRPEPHLDPHRGWCQRAEFLGHALTDAREHGGATREHHVAEEITANVHVALPEIFFAVKFRGKINTLYVFVCCFK